jgi:hypothetical protein
MFGGIDIGSKRHTLARLDSSWLPIGTLMPLTEDRAGKEASLKALGSRPP